MSGTRTPTDEHSPTSWPDFRHKSCSWPQPSHKQHQIGQEHQPTGGPGSHSQGQAVLADGAVADIDTAERVVDDLLEVHRSYLRQFASIGK